MNAESRHCAESIDDWLAGRLGDQQRRDLEEHFLSCAACRAERDGLAAVQRAVRARFAEPAPENLETKLAAWLDREDALPSTSAPAVQLSRRPPAKSQWRGLRFAAAAAIAAMALTSLFYVLRPGERRGDPVFAALRDFGELSATKLPPSMAAIDAAEIEERWRRAGIRFPVRVFDLVAMGIEVAGGDAPRLGSSRAARTVYSDAGRWIVCWMFEERAARAWSPSVERRFQGGFEFEVHRQEGATLVLWREGDVVCMLVGGGDPERVISLAQAKAMVPAKQATGSLLRAS